MSRYVILQHDSPRGRHWDLMLESGAALRTWALAEPPQPGRPIPAEPLPDHRIDYLHLQGPISGGRGTVAQWDFGTCELLAESQREVQVRLSGGRLQGVATLRTSSGETWEFSFAPQPPSP
jgi:hypothetical protein